MRIKISNRLILILTVITTALLLLAITVALNPLPDGDKFYTHIYIHGIPVGGLTYDEAEAALMQRYQPKLDELVISFTHDGSIISSRTYKSLAVRLNFTPSIHAAMEYTNRRSLPARISGLFGRPHVVDTPPEVILDNTRLEAEIRAAADKIQIPPSNARFTYNDNQISIIPEKPGILIDVHSAYDKLKHLLLSSSEGTVELQSITLPPRFSKSDLDFTVSVLGSFSTPISSEENPRVRNIQRASNRIHNYMLYPGDIFSASNLIGSHLPGNNYEAAIVLVRGEPVEDIGGGICQVVTTLYKAVLLAELAVLQRHNHSAKVSYADYGFDATIAGDYYDFKFKNNTSHPILITSQLQSSALYVAIHGNDLRPANRSLQFSSQRVDITSPAPYKEVLDENLTPGTRIVILESQLGYTYEVYKHIIVDGREIDVIKINTSNYRPLQGVINVGRSE